MKEETLNKIKEDLIANVEFLKLVDKTRMNYKDEIEEDNNDIYVYYKSLYYSRVIPDDIITVSYGNKKEDFRIYINLETGEGVNIFRDYFDSFEEEKNVIIPDTPIYTAEDFFNLRAKFIFDSIVDGQDKTIQKVLKK